MLKKVLIGIVSFIISSIIVGLIPLQSIITNQTASDAITVVSSLLLALAIYKMLSPLLLKKTQDQ